MKIYLDNCCFNRPYDDQTQLRINLETQAKPHIQQSVIYKRFDLVWSFILEFENSQNPFIEKREAIAEWRNLASEIVLSNDDIVAFAKSLSPKDIKPKDALHIACAVNAGCDYFLTTDKKLLNTPVPEIRILSPIQFVSEAEE